jgi:ATP-dependent exoDNAse (exonuclease V) alpha subunit
VAAERQGPEVAVEGEVEVVTFENRESGFRVVKLAVPGRRERLALVGVFPPVAVGSRVRARGTVEVDRQHGEQLRATSVTELAPTTLAGIEKYLGSGMIKGVGEVTARRIVARFGLGTLKVLDEQPHRLREVEGLGRTRAEALVAAWQEQRAIRDVMVFLQAHGASPHLATRIFKRYGPKAVNVVSNDPYRLAIDVWGVGFRTADRIAAAMGIAKDSIERMQAALLQALRDATDAGHCFVVGDDLTARAARLLAADASEVETPDEGTLERLRAGLVAAASAKYVVAEASGALVPAAREALGDAAIFEARTYETEARLAARLAAVARAEVAPLKGIDDAIARFERDTRTVLAEEQRLALDHAARRSLLVITGGPGVGKTTIVKAILDIFDRAGVMTRLAAPTGRAAKRMSEATGKDAATLHRLLEFDPKSGTFKPDAGDTNADFFVIEKRDPDETRRLLVELVTRRIPRRFALDPVRDIQVLTPMNRGPVGTQILNEALQSALNPTGPSLPRGRVTFRVGDKVMQLRNDYDRNVYNGDVGVVAAVDEEGEALVVRFDDREVTYDGSSLDELALAYACTIHKSQGSEYPAVVIPLLTSHFVMLSKNLLYTAVTRGKRLVVLVADPRAVALALAPQPPGQDRRENRSTKLAERIRSSEPV